MYNLIEGGTTIDIQGLVCSIPPEGYVFDITKQQMEYRGVTSRSSVPEEQYWERVPLPAWYKEMTKKEVAYERTRKDDMPPFYDAQLEAYKKQEWDRRLNGHWFLNYNSAKSESEAVYLTGNHYMFLQWWQMDVGYGRFRFPDLDYFYFLQYCLEDPNCMGMLEITKRRFGKTFRGGLFLYDYVTRTRMSNGGIQSKTGADAKKMFGKAVISPFKKLPRFFRPEYDMSLGITPKTEIRFQQTNVRGKKAEEGLDKEELGSMIDWSSAETLAYDGQKLHRYFSDEWAKTSECNIYDRHDVVKYCLLDDGGKIIGKALYSSTVEKIASETDGVQEAAKNLWADSDQTDRKENGRTASGMYRFFMTADRGRNIDMYGFPDVEKTVKEILADRSAIAHNMRALSNLIKKEARTIQEAFSTDSDKCIFNVINIDRRDDELREHPPFKRKVIFWRDIDQKIRWRDVSDSEKSFHWEITWGLNLGLEANKYIVAGGLRKPVKTEDFVIAVDGYGNNQGGRKYGSKASAWIGRKYDAKDPDNTFKAIGNLFGRPTEKSKLHEQVMMAAEWFSCQAWFEHNSDEYDTYFKERGKMLYLGIYPLSTIAPDKRDTTDRHRGFPTTPFSLTRQNDMAIAYFENYTHLIDWRELLDSARKYDPHDRTKYDLMVSFEMLVVCMAEKVVAPMRPPHPLIKVYPNPRQNGTVQ
jgi:hypothetical protein